MPSATRTKSVGDVIEVFVICLLAGAGVGGIPGILFKMPAIGVLLGLAVAVWIAVALILKR